MKSPLPVSGAGFLVRCFSLGLPAFFCLFTLIGTDGSVAWKRTVIQLPCSCGEGGAVAFQTGDVLRPWIRFSWIFPRNRRGSGMLFHCFHLDTSWWFVNERFLGYEKTTFGVVQKEIEIKRGWADILLCSIPFFICYS